MRRKIKRNQQISFFKNTKDERQRDNVDGDNIGNSSSQSESLWSSLYKDQMKKKNFKI